MKSSLFSPIFSIVSPLAIWSYRFGNRPFLGIWLPDGLYEDLVNFKGKNFPKETPEKYPFLDTKKSLLLGLLTKPPKHLFYHLTKLGPLEAHWVIDLLYQ